MEPESGAGEALDLPDEVRESNVPEMERKVGIDELGYGGDWMLRSWLHGMDGEWWYRALPETAFFPGEDR